MPVPKVSVLERVDYTCRLQIVFISRIKTNVLFRSNKTIIRWHKSLYIIDNFKFYSCLLSQRFCQLNKSYMEEYVKAFNDQVSKSTTDENKIIWSPIKNEKNHHYSIDTGSKLERVKFLQRILRTFTTKGQGKNGPIADWRVLSNNPRSPCKS